MHKDLYNDNDITRTINDYDKRVMNKFSSYYEVNMNTFKLNTRLNHLTDQITHQSECEPKNPAKLCLEWCHLSYPTLAKRVVLWGVVFLCTYVPVCFPFTYDILGMESSGVLRILNPSLHGKARLS